MVGIAIPGEGPLNVKRTLGSLVPHPAAIGKIMGAKTGISAPRMHLAGGGLAGASNIENSMFQPDNASASVPNVDVNFIQSPNLATGAGPPKPPSSQPQKQSNPMQDIAQTGAGVNTLVNAGSGLGTLWNGSTMSAADAAAYNAENGLTAGMDDFASAGDTIGGLGDFFSSAGDALMGVFAAKGGAIERADGGDVPGLSSLTNSLMRRESGETFHSSGLLNSAGPGRTDTINTNVPSGAYVIPADVVSGVGEGNTLAGSAIIDRMFSSQPHGVQARPIRKGEGPPRPPSSRPEPPPTGVQPGPTVNTAAINDAGAYARGGKTDDGKAPVVLAGGEVTIHPQDIIRKFGSLKRGHAILDHWVVGMRQKIAKEMMGLPNPVGSKVKKK